MRQTSREFPEIEAELLDLRQEVRQCNQELEQEAIDLSDTITQVQAMKLRLAEQMRRRKDD